MLVTGEGPHFGTVGGGKIEARAIEEALAILRDDSAPKTRFTGRLLYGSVQRWRALPRVRLRRARPSRRRETRPGARTRWAVCRAVVPPGTHRS
ncbi:MAG: XdhC family protein [Thermoanaerobaculia bacterium]